MKLLILDPIYRDYLICKRALKLDAYGNEILAGLTAAESTKYAAIIEMVNVDAKLDASVDRERFLELYKRHTAALTRRESVSDTERPLG